MPTARAHRMSPQEWLEDLIALFPDERLSRSDFEVIPPDEVPAPYASLLVHEHHMTVTLERHHGVPVHLDVIAVRHVGNDYARRLRLRRGKEGDVVLSGIMRFLLDYCPEAVRNEIIEARKPLGRLLIEHEVMRRIEAVTLLKVRLRGGLRDAFGPSRGEVAYGRLAIIYCNELPAVELLEIVAPES